MLATLSLNLLKQILEGKTVKGKVLGKFIFAVYFIPSVFLWTSVGLRESFIIAELTVFLAGLNYLFQGLSKRGTLLLFIGSYGLVSTKNYLWACLMVALIMSSIFFLVRKIERRQIARLFIAGFVLPVAIFASITSAYALDSIFHGGITETGARSDDSISKIYVEIPGSGTGTGTETGTVPTKELITFHGDYSLIALHFYLLDNLNSLFSRALGVFHLDSKIQTIWDEKIQLGLVHKDKKVGTDTSSLNGHILKPGQISNPISMLWPAFIFLFGPHHFIGGPGFAVGTAALESPMWWAFYALVIFQSMRFRKVKFLRAPPLLFTLIFLTGLIAFSALVEANLGTSFRHQSVPLVPLVFLYVRLAQRGKEQKDLELEVI